MTKAELIHAMANNKNIPGMTKKHAADFVEALFDTVAKSIKKEKRFSYPGFGTWTVRERKARMGRNPQTGESIKIKASKTVGFKPSADLKKGL
jgi:DNA-binding protein HU-beta